MIYRALKIVFMLSITAMAYAGFAEDAEYCVDWSISFKLDHKSNANSEKYHRGVQAKVLGLESFRVKDQYSWSSRQSLIQTMSKSEIFKILPFDTKFSKSTSLKVGKSYILMAYQDGRFSAPFKFTVKNKAPLHLKNVLLRFPKAPKNIFKVRIISLHTAKFRADYEFGLVCEAGVPGGIRYGFWKIASAYTDDMGVLTFHNVPERRLFLQEDRFVLNGIKHFSTLGPNGTPQYADRGIRPLSITKMKQLKDEDIPIIYYVHPEMGLLWKTEMMLPLKREIRLQVKNGPYEEIVREGTELSFVQEILPKYQKLGLMPTSFKVVIGKNGFIKTPIVPKGIYTLTTNSPRYKIKNSCNIYGLGSIGGDERLYCFSRKWNIALQDFVYT